MDKNKNYYIAVGKFIYKIDKNNKVSSITKRYLDNHFFIFNAKYYQSKLYLLVCNFHGKIGVASINTEGKDFQYLFDVTLTDLPNTNLAISNNTIYLYANSENNSFINAYSINTPYSLVSENRISILSQRTDKMKLTFPNYPYNNILHISNNSFYSLEKIRIEGNTPKTDVNFVGYNPLNESKKKYNLNKYFDEDKSHSVIVDFINNYWFITSSQGVYKLNSDFSEETQLISSNDLSYYIFNGKNGSIVIEE